jgi:recombinational DNA repair ATPase RecF
LRNSDNPSRELLAGFTEPLAQCAAIIARKRLEWIERAALILNETAQKLAPGQPFLRLIYASNWVPKTDGLSLPIQDLGPGLFSGQGPLPSLELLEQAFWKTLSTLELAELRSRHSLVGTHRDDWAFYLGEQTLKGHGSQGEVRSALLALKIAEIELFRKATGHRPLFLLDDFSSELDRERRSYLLRFLTETDLQVFVTTTEDSVWMGKRFRVSNGSLEEVTHEHQPEQPGSR